jgi:hypothetical protein
MPTTIEKENSLSQAYSQLSYIEELLHNYDTAEDESDKDDALTAIYENPLELTKDYDQMEDQDGEIHYGKELSYNLLLCTGGPAVRVIGNLNKWKEADSAKLQHQDWFTSWKDAPLTKDQKENLIRYVNFFLGC